MHDVLADAWSWLDDVTVDDELELDGAVPGVGTPVGRGERQPGSEGRVGLGGHH